MVLLKKYTLLQLSFLIFFLFLAANSSAQDTNRAVTIANMDSANVKWIEQWPSENSKKKSINFQKRFKEFVIGKKNCFLSKPNSILVDSSNQYWVLDQGNNTIMHIQNDEAEIPHFIAKKNIIFPSLIGLCEFKNNTMLFTDSYLKKIFILNTDKNECKVLNDSMLLEQPTGIAFSKVKNEIWVVETSAHRITILNAKGELIRHIGSRGNEKGQFNFPTYIWIDNIGNAYIVDAMNFRIQVLNKEGEVISVFGSLGDATGYFARPKGIATDSHGNIYVVDALFNAVQIFDIKGNFLLQFGEQGHGQGEFWMPTGIFIDKKDKIYIADSYNSRIQVFQLSVESKK